MSIDVTEFKITPTRKFNQTKTPLPCVSWVSGFAEGRSSKRYSKLNPFRLHWNMIDADRVGTKTCPPYLTRAQRYSTEDGIAKIIRLSDGARVEFNWKGDVVADTTGTALPPSTQEARRERSEPSRAEPSRGRTRSADRHKGDCRESTRSHQGFQMVKVKIWASH